MFAVLFCPEFSSWILVFLGFVPDFYRRLSVCVVRDANGFVLPIGYAKKYGQCIGYCCYSVLRRNVHARVLCKQCRLMESLLQTLTASASASGVEEETSSKRKPSFYFWMTS